MKTLIRLFTLLMISTPTLAGEVITSDFGTTLINGHVTVGAYTTTRNNFQDRDTTDITGMNEVGMKIYHSFNEYFAASFYSTTENFLDFGFLQGRYIDGNATYGVRVGRINIPSGPFAGYGPFSDGMNFLPQGTAPSRVGQSFYRFDGVQIYNEYSFNTASGLGIEVSYGEHVVTSEKGVFEPAFFAIFEPDSIEAEFSKPALLINVDYYYENFEFVLNYSDMLGSVKGTYNNTIPLEWITENPADHGQFIDVSIPVEDDSYPSRLLKLGVIYNTDRWEHMVVFFQWVDTPGAMDVWLSSLKPKFVSTGYTYIARYITENNTILYGGYTEYRGTFDNEVVAQTLKWAPDWVDRGQSVLMGGRYQLTDNIHLIAEAHLNKGGIYLSGEFQDPLTTKEYWGLYSFTANLVF